MKRYQENINNKANNKNLFLIYTPFQLFSVLNIIDSMDISNENHLVYMNESVKKYTKNIKKNFNVNILEYEFSFNTINKSRKRFIVYINIIKEMVQWKKLMTSVENTRTKYNQIFIPSDAVGCNVVFSHFYNINKQLILNVFDDGMGTYEKGYLNPNKKIIYSKISKLIFGNFFWQNIRNVYCYKPDLIDNENQIEIKSIKMSDRVNNIISIDGDSEIYKYKNKKIIYLDQGESNKILDDFFELSKVYFKENDIIAKVHPRLTSCIPESYKNIDNSGKAFESIYANLDSEDIILVSSYSTACLTPYMIFDKFPYVIFLGSIESNRLENVFESKYMKNIYKEYKMGRLFIPKTMDELELNLQHILREINKGENKKYHDTI